MAAAVKPWCRWPEIDLRGSEVSERVASDCSQLETGRREGGEILECLR